MMNYDIELTSILNISVEILTDIFMKEMCYLNLIINRYMQYTPQQLKLIELLWSKELTFGCLIKSERLSLIISKDYNTEWLKTGRYRMMDDGENLYTWIIKDDEIIWHEPTIADFHRWASYKRRIVWEQFQACILIHAPIILEIQYDSEKSILNQSIETQEKIIELITNHS